MNKLAISALALAGMTASASAADIFAPVEITPLPLWTWTGPYAGLHAGFGWSKGRAVVTCPDAEILFEESTADAGWWGASANAVMLFGERGCPDDFPRRFSMGADADGFMGGAQVGYNFQFGALVTGVEADISFTDWNGSGAFGPATAERKVKWFGTLRGRVGTAWDQFLLYLTGGLAFADVEFLSSSTTKTGFTVGGGAEFAVTESISIKGEYLYFDLGSVNVVGPPVEGGTPMTARSKFDGHVVRAGVNFRFWSEPMPVVARY